MAGLKGLYILDADAMAMVYGPAERTAIARHVTMIAPPQTRQSIAQQPSLLADVDVLFTGWGSPVVDAAFLDRAPRLKAIFYGAGAVGGWMTPAVNGRGVVVTSAAVANAQPVAEYALATTLFSLKHGWALTRQTAERQTFVPRDGAPGCYGTTVGLISLGLTGRAFARMLRPFDLKVIGYDPFVSPAEMRMFGVEPVASLAEIFARSHVISLHTPELPETVGLITGALLASMRPGATFLNTARGGVVCEAEMVDVLRARPDLHAVLDVTEPEPPVRGSPLYTLPNVTLTPHIAGSVGAECRRMGQYMVDELGRYVAGEPLRWAIDASADAPSSHRPSEKPAAVAEDGRHVAGAAVAASA